MFIATLIASETLSAGDLSAAIDRIAAVGCAPATSAWIEPEKAVDILFGISPEAARKALEGVFDGVDVVVQAVQGREKKLLVADMDSTMITVECIDELADYAGIKPQIAAITEAAMRGELDFEGALDARVALLKGLDEAVIERCLAERVTLMPGAVALVQTMCARGATAILVSGGFTRFADPVAERIGFHRAIANRLELGAGVLTGTVAKPIVGSDTKLQTLLAAGEINDMNAQLIRLVKKDEIDAGFVYVLLRNIEDAEKKGEEPMVRLLSHLHTVTQEELEKRTAPALGLLHKLTRLDDAGIRGRVLRDNLSPKTSLPLPDGSEMPLAKPTAAGQAGSGRPAGAAAR